MSMSFLKNLTQRKRVITCQNCRQQLRIPLHSKSTLRVTCPKCHVQFDVGFINPLSELLRWDKEKSAKQNLLNSLLTFKKLPIGTRVILIAFLFSLIMMGISLTKKIIPQTDTSIQQTESLNNELNF